MAKLTKLLIFLIVLAPISSAVSVGASPGFIDYGTLDPGSTQEISFYLTTNSEEAFQVNPYYTKTSSYTGTNQPISMSNVSEQDIGSWIRWTQDTYTIDPENSQTYNLPDGSTVTAQGEVSMEIQIPSDAEPGYRIGNIELEPAISAEGGGAGARLIAQTIPSFAFRVPGDVQRNIDAAGFQAVRTGEDSVQMILQLRNTGTVTTSFTGGTAQLFNQNGENIDQIPFGSATLAPGEYAELDRTWRYSNIEGGEYRLEGIGNYTTGETYISSEFVITDAIQERQSVDQPSGGEVEEQQNDAPLVMIVIISVLLGTLLYLMEVELTWVMLLTGGTAVVLYTLLGSASNALVLIPLLAIGIMWYI